MKYNFDEIIERRGTNSYKWDLVKEDGSLALKERQVLLSQVV